MSHTPPHGPDDQRADSSDEGSEPWQNIPPAPWDNSHPDAQPAQPGSEPLQPDSQSAPSDWQSGVEEGAQAGASGAAGAGASGAGAGAGAGESGAGESGAAESGAGDSMSDFGWGGSDNRPPPGHIYPDDPFEPAGGAGAPGPAAAPPDETVYEVAPYPTSWPPPSPYDQHEQPEPQQPQESGFSQPEQPGFSQPEDPGLSQPEHAGSAGDWPSAAGSEPNPSDQTNPAEHQPAPPSSDATQLAMRPYSPPPPETGSAAFAPDPGSPPPPQSGATSLPPQTGPTQATPQNGQGYGGQPDYSISYAAPSSVPHIAGATPAPRPDKQKSRKGLAWTALSIVVLLIVGAGVWFFVIRDDGSNQAGGEGDTTTSAEASESGDTSSGSEASGSESSGSEGSSASDGEATDSDGKLKPELQTQVQALYDGYNKAWDTAAASGDFAPVAKFAVDNAHPDVKPDEAQCQAHNQAAGAKKGYREKFTIDFATVAPAPDWTPPGASAPPSGEVFSATAERFAGTGLASNPQPVEVHFAIVDSKAYMFPDCS